jgi:hypothetical protein
MSPTTDHDPRKQVIFNPADRDWTAQYDGQFVGVFKRPSLARQALDAAGYAAARRESRVVEPFSPTDDPLTLYCSGGPQIGLPVSATSLDAALALFCTTYEQPKLHERAQRARQLLDDPSRWEIMPDGAVQIVGTSATYRVTDEACRTLAGADCPDQKYRTGIIGGQCYHTIARELLRLGQVIEHGPQMATPESPTSHLAFVRLPGRVLGLALGIVYLAAQPVCWHLYEGRLTIGTAEPPAYTLDLPARDGAGAAELVTTTIETAALWRDLKPRAAQCEAIDVCADLSDPALTLSANGFTTTIPATLGVKEYP